MYLKLKQQVLDANRMLYKLRLAIHTWGNVSQIDREHRVVAIKPSGVPICKLRVEDIVLVDLNGNIIEGKLHPSTDTLTHLELYRSFIDINSIIHTHSRYATIWAQAHKAIPVLGTTHADYFKDEIPCTRELTKDEINGNYELETGKVIIETFNALNMKPLVLPAVLVSSHGPFCWGNSALEAVQHAMILEEIACMSYHTIQLNEHLKPLNKHLLYRHYDRKHGVCATYGQKI